MSKA
jgi:flagellar motor switch protein FliG